MFNIHCVSCNLEKGSLINDQKQMKNDWMSVIELKVKRRSRKTNYILADD